LDFAPGTRIVARILIVEDSPIDRTDPELVLMDIQLPGKDGFTLLGEIRDSRHRVLRVLALTAHAMSGDRERAMAGEAVSD
jgi:CheY-like chemotaxis protein